MSIGKISEFNIRTDNWRLYIERLEQYFVVNKIEKDMYVPTLITVVGAECYELLVNLCTPKKPRTMGFSELTTIVEKHLQPKPSTLAERYKFRCRMQDDNETVADYIAVLKKMSTTCDFGGTLEENLRDQFMCGLRSESIRQRLFAEDDIDYKKAYRLATSLEAAEKNAASITGRVSTTTVGTGSVACHVVERIGSSTRSTKERISRFYNVFSDGLGRFTGGTVSIRVREGARPVFLRARPLAYALRAPVERALDQMEATAFSLLLNTLIGLRLSFPYLKKMNLYIIGHFVDKQGVHACPEKVKAIVGTPPPTNVSEVRAFLGLANYYSKFIKNASTILSPLYELLRKDVKFHWNSACDFAFNKVKELLVSSKVLAHYSLSLPLVLTVDASAVGVGAVISHVTATGERPIAFASRSLCTAERSYSQIEREALAIIFGIRKFHQYLYGREFILRTDHKPLTFIFGEKVGIQIMAASRLQRWAILLSGYNYKIEYVPSASNCADSLSRLPLPIKEAEFSEEMTYLNFVETFLPVTKSQVKHDTLKDPILLDSSSKWIEIFEVAKTNASSVIRILRSTFARFGLPMEIVSDQGPPFTSVEFRDFLERNGIRQSLSPAYHPASNGAAENAVKLSYRNSVHSTTGESPAMLLQRRTLRSRLDLLRNDGSREERVRQCQQRQAGGGGARALCEGAPVWTRDYGRGEKWVPAIVRAVDGTRRYLLEAGDGRQMQRHIDQIRPRSRISDAHISMSPSSKNNGVEEAVEPSVLVADEIRQTELERKSISAGHNCEAVGGASQLESDTPLQTDGPLPIPPRLSPQSELTLSPVKRDRRPPLRYGIDE
ncbi:unnamed protein product [Euphydryas editha]|uniref:Integrase catalytic domain-containing protein n=1 Tax=Euphydryas editha TaxID=104508 RepID=A0AAU9VCY1_EUPED|nr:unnamed protein product [Euphydryas editha]